MQYLIFYPPGDKDIQACMARWLSEAGGSLSLEEVQRKLYDRFKYYIKSINNEKEARQKGLIDKAYRLENGMVSCR